jgi:hypothetical protein
VTRKGPSTKAEDVSSHWDCHLQQEADAVCLAPQVDEDVILTLQVTESFLSLQTLEGKFCVSGVQKAKSPLYGNFWLKV